MSTHVRNPLYIFMYSMPPIFFIQLTCRIPLFTNREGISVDHDQLASEMAADLALHCIVKIYDKFRKCR